MTVAGVSAGVAGAIALWSVLARFVFGVSPLDPWPYAGAVVVLMSVALLAAYRPAGLAARVNPITVLRDG
jgi:hypothetical protein